MEIFILKLTIKYNSGFLNLQKAKMAPSTILIINLAIADALFLFNIPFKISGMFLKILGYKVFRQELSTGRDRN